MSYLWKITKLSILALLFTTFCFILHHNNNNDNNDYVFRAMSSASNKFTSNFTYVEETYNKFKCTSIHSVNNLPSESSKSATISKYKSLFQQNEKLSDLIEKLLSGDNDITSELIWQVASIAAPVVVFFGLVLLGWFTYCSCCCYEYCPIVCNRQDKNAPYTYSERYVPVVVILFSAASLLIPIVISYLNFENVVNAFTIAFCKLLSGNYKLKTGKGLEGTYDQDEWVGYTDNNNYFDKLNSDFLSFVSVLPIDNSIGKITTELKSIPKLTSEVKYYEDIKEEINIYVEERYTKTKEVFEQLQNSLSYIKAHKSNFINLFSLMKEYYEANSEFNSTYSTLLNFFYYILHDLNPLLITFRIVLIISQLIVFTFNIILSILIFFRKKGKNKYFGHASWCLSSLNIVIMAIVMILFYSLASILINVGTFLEINSNLEIEKVEAKVTSTTIPWIRCLNEYSSEYDNFYYKNYEKEIEALIQLSDSMLKIKMFNDDNPLTINIFADKIGLIVKNATKRETFNDYNKISNYVSLSDYSDILEKLANIVDYRAKKPLQILNRCKDKFSFEVIFDIDECTYPYYNLSEINDTTKERISKGKACFDISNKTMLMNFFSPKLSSYGTLYSTFKATIDEAQTFENFYYNNDNSWLKYLIANLTNLTIAYANTSQYIQTNTSIINTDIIDSLNVYLHFPLSDLSSKYLSEPYHTSFSYLSSSSSLINFMSFTSCSFFHSISDDLVTTLQYEIISSIYILLVVYIFLLCYNSLSSIFGLIATLINFSPVVDIEDCSVEDDYDLQSERSTIKKNS